MFSGVASSFQVLGQPLVVSHGCLVNPQSLSGRRPLSTHWQLLPCQPCADVRAQVSVWDAASGLVGPRWFAHPWREDGSKIELHQAEYAVHDFPRTAVAR
jgi:hypothetical protein